jgi:hypothetical protein
MGAIVRIKYAGRDHRKMIAAVPTRVRAPHQTFLAEIGMPQEPQASWRCGTDLVWPVLRIIDHPEIVIYGNAWVCRHEIEAGD